MLTDKEKAEVMDAPIPGESLTANPDNPMPWETPPEYTSVEQFVDDLFMKITDRDNLDGVLNSIRKGVPIEDVAQVILFQAMASGKITTDLVLLAAEPTVYMLIGLSQYAGIENAVLYPEDDMIYDEDEELSALEQALKGKEDMDIKDIPVPKGMSKSLISKIQKGEV